MIKQTTEEEYFLIIRSTTKTGKQIKYKNEYQNDPKVLKAPLHRSLFMFSLSRLNIGLRMIDSY